MGEHVYIQIPRLHGDGLKITIPGGEGLGICLLKSSLGVLGADSLVSGNHKSCPVPTFTGEALRRRVGCSHGALVDLCMGRTFLRGLA